MYKTLCGSLCVSPIQYYPKKRDRQREGDVDMEGEGEGEGVVYPVVLLTEGNGTVVDAGHEAAAQ